MMTIDVIDIVLGQFSVKHPTKIIGCCNFGHSMFGKIDFRLLDPFKTRNSWKTARHGLPCSFGRVVGVPLSTNFLTLSHRAPSNIWTPESPAPRARAPAQPSKGNWAPWIKSMVFRALIFTFEKMVGEFFDVHQSRKDNVVQSYVI